MMPSMKIDSHHHFWRYTPSEFGWIDQSMQTIARDFLPGDLSVEIQAAGIDQAISVQARQTMEETQFLLQCAADNEFIAGVVGWAPLAERSLRTTLDELADNPKLKGIRHVVQDEPDDQFILGEAFNAGVSLLKEYELAYDILIFERQLQPSVEFVDRHPNQVFVLDHIAKPKVSEGTLQPWGKLLKQLAERENVYCKWSGVVTEADWQGWNLETLRPYFDLTLEAFGPNRMMFGSDWPVCLLATEYRRWLNASSQLTASLSPTEQQMFYGGTATKAYSL